MKKILVKYEENGQCSTGDFQEGHAVGGMEEIVDMIGGSYNANLYNKEPYRSSLKLQKIKDKVKEIIKGYSHIDGLQVGEMNDKLWKEWISDIILFSDKYKDEVIDETQISFPVDPNSDIITLDL